MCAQVDCVLCKPRSWPGPSQHQLDYSAIATSVIVDRPPALLAADVAWFTTILPIIPRLQACTRDQPGIILRGEKSDHLQTQPSKHPTLRTKNRYLTTTDAHLSHRSSICSSQLLLIVDFNRSEQFARIESMQSLSKNRGVPS